MVKNKELQRKMSGNTEIPSQIRQRYGELTKRCEHLSYRVTSMSENALFVNYTKRSITLTATVGSQKAQIKIQDYTPSGNTAEKIRERAPKQHGLTNTEDCASVQSNQLNMQGSLPLGDASLAFVVIGKSENAEDEIPLTDILYMGHRVIYLPAEEISSFKGGLRLSADKLFLPKRRGRYSAGKIMLWAYGIMLAADYLSFTANESLRLVATGHGILAEAALLAAAMDKRFFSAAVSSPHLTHRSAQFLPELLYSPNYDKSIAKPEAEIFGEIFPRKVIIVYSENSVPYEADLVYEMLMSQSSIGSTVSLLEDYEMAPDSLLGNEKFSFLYRSGSTEISNKDFIFYIGQLSKVSQSAYYNAYKENANCIKP